MPTSDTPALSPEEEGELRETAHVTLKEMRVPWACGGGDHGPYCDAIFAALCAERLAERRRAVALVRNRDLYVVQGRDGIARAIAAGPGGK